MRILLWHGYLLGGTGSNVYTRQLAREWRRAGHDVTVLSQEPRPGDYDLGGATTVRPEVGGLLPVFVLDRYEGYEVRLVQDCSRGELDVWVEANAAAVRALAPADLVFANHVLLGGPGRRGHRWAVRRQGPRLRARVLDAGKRGTVGVGGGGARRSASDLRRLGAHPLRCSRRSAGTSERVHEVPPGVDIDLWQPEARDVARARLLDEARRDGPNPGNQEERIPDDGNAQRLEAFLRGDEPTVVYFGKLIEQKGVHVLIDAMRGVGARLVVVGFGPERTALERQAAAGGVRALFTGPLEHRHLRHLLAFADACVVPSVFPEAFGMVAAEAAATGCPPIVARHSGLAEVAAGLEAELPPQLARLVSAPTGDVSALRRAARGAVRAPCERPRAAPRDRAAGRRGALELGGRRPTAPRTELVTISRKAVARVRFPDGDVD